MSIYMTSTTIRDNRYGFLPNNSTSNNIQYISYSNYPDNWDVYSNCTNNDGTVIDLGTSTLDPADSELEQYKESASGHYLCPCGYIPRIRRNHDGSHNIRCPRCFMQGSKAIKAEDAFALWDEHMEIYYRTKIRIRHARGNMPVILINKPEKKNIEDEIPNESQEK